MTNEQMEMNPPTLATAEEHPQVYSVELKIMMACRVPRSCLVPFNGQATKFILLMVQKSGDHQLTLRISHV